MGAAPALAGPPAVCHRSRIDAVPAAVGSTIDPHPIDESRIDGASHDEATHDEATHEPARHDPPAPDRGSAPTVEEQVRARLATELGGIRGSLETALPLVVFTMAYLLTEVIRTSVIAAVATAVAAYLLRLLQRSSTRFVLNGLVGIVVAAAIASFTGQAEAAFLPSMIQNAVWVVVLGGSMVVRWPLGGLFIGAVLGDTSAWRDDPAIVRLGYRLTLVLLAPMVIRLIVQVPLYLAGAVGWLGVSRLVLGWPLYAAALAIAGLVLLRGETPVDGGAPEGR